MVGWMPRSGTLRQLVRVSQVSRARASESCVAANLSSTASAWGSPGEVAMSEVCAVWAAGSSLGNRGPQLPGLSGPRLQSWTCLKSGLRIALSSMRHNCRENSALLERVLF